MSHLQCKYKKGKVFFPLDYIKRSCVVLFGKLCFSYTTSPHSSLSVVNNGKSSMKEVFKQESSEVSICFLELNSLM